MKHATLRTPTMFTRAQFGNVLPNDALGHGGPAARSHLGAVRHDPDPVVTPEVLARVSGDGEAG
jgi:hypothetical protein